jgi:hypothetical protein
MSEKPCLQWLFSLLFCIEGSVLMADRDLAPKSEYVENLPDPNKPQMPMEWKFSEKGHQALIIANQMANIKHGLYASIPMICKGPACPYAATCPLLAIDLAPERERCPLEISKIMKRFEQYSHELAIDEDNIIDMTLVKDLIDIDIQLIRAENKLAIDADFIQDVIIMITEHGDEITQPQIHKAVDYKDKLLKKRHEILGLLNSTRKDKAGDKLTIVLDPSSYASQLMSQAAEMKERIIDVTPNEDDE